MKMTDSLQTLPVTGKRACVFGGTGFVGRLVVRELARAGYTVKVATRVPERAYFLRTCGVVGQIVPFACDYGDSAIAEAVKGCEAVVSLAGILYERGKASKFRRVHVDIPGKIAASSARAGVARLVHVSALGCDVGRSRYAKTKREGEQAVLAAFPNATILRPSLVFGPGDGFFSTFARLSRLLPALPLIGGGRTRFQPVYVGDVADAVMAAITLPAPGERNPQGKIYELGGPEILNFRDLYARLFEQTGTARALVPLPWAAAKLQGAVMSLLPGPLLSADQVESLKTDSVVSPGAPGLAALGVAPTALGAVLPGYLARFRPGGRFADKKAA